MSISIGTNANFSDLPLRTFRSDLTASGHPELILKDLNEMIHDLNTELPQDLVYSHYLNHLPLQVVSSNQWQNQFSEQLSKIKMSIHQEIHQKHLNWKEKFQINKFKNNFNNNSNNNHKVKNRQTDINKNSNLENQKITKTDLSFCLNKIIDNNWVIFNEYNLDPNVVDRTLPNSWFENSYASGLGWALGAGLGGKLANANQNVLITVGDGSYLFNTPLSAHLVASQYRIPVMIVVFNDQGWSTIRKRTMGSHPYGVAVQNNDFVLCEFKTQMDYHKMAEASGGKGFYNNYLLVF